MSIGWLNFGLMVFCIIDLDGMQQKQNSWAV
jgi:hypothetical protein